MHNPATDQTISPQRVSRRRLLALAGGAAAAASSARPARLLAQASPSAATPVATPLPMPSTLAADASPAFQAVAAALSAAMQHNHIPGAALGILAGDREEHVALGLASLSSLRPVTPDTLFQIGSLAKTYTSTVIWRLIDEGALALDAKVRTYLPDLKLQDEATAAQVAVSNLLDHSAGWYGDEGFDTGDGDDALARYVAERMPQLPQLFPLGAFFSYNNSGFQLLGRLIEVATGTTYNAAMQDLLFAPLGLADTLLDRAAVLQRPYADGHVYLPINGRNALAVQTPLWIPRSTDPAGGIWATTRDVIRYARFHLDQTAIGGPASIVRPATLKRMQEPVIAVPGLPLRMGRDWFVQEVAGMRAIFHGGDTLSQHTEFVAIPDKNFAFILLTNNDGGGAAAAPAVLDAAFANYPGLGALVGRLGLGHASTIPADTPTVSLPAATLAEYAGRYADPGNIVTMGLNDGSLEATLQEIAQPGAWLPTIAPPPSPRSATIRFVAKDQAVGGTNVIPFVRDSAGRVGWVAVSLRLIPHTGPA